MKLISYRQVLGNNDVAFAVKTDGRRFIFNDGGESITGRWPLKLSRQFNKVIVFHSGESGNVYVGDYMSSVPDEEVPSKYHLSFSNSQLVGRSAVNWTEFTHGISPGYSRVYLQGGDFNEPPVGKRKPNKKIIKVEVFERSEQVKEWILKKAEGRCESCGKVPFLTPEGAPYLEVHHVKRLADGGSDTVTNTVAICAECHRELHYGQKRNDIVENLYRLIARLIRE